MAIRSRNSSPAVACAYTYIMPINALQFSTHYGFSFGYNFISVRLWGARIGESIHVDSVTIPNAADEMFRVWVVAVLFF